MLIMKLLGLFFVVLEALQEKFEDFPILIDSVELIEREWFINSSLLKYSGMHAYFSLSPDKFQGSPKKNCIWSVTFLLLPLSFYLSFIFIDDVYIFIRMMKILYFNFFFLAQNEAHKNR